MYSREAKYSSASRTPIIEARLPNLMHESQFSLCPKRKSALDQLDRSLQRFPRTNQQMEMVWHHHKLVQEILSPGPIVKQDIEKEPRHSVGLKNIALLKCRAGDE